MSKVLECCRQKGPNLHSKSFKYSLPNLPKSLLPPEIRHLPALPFARVHWTQKLTAKKSRFKFCELFSVGALQQIAWSQNFSRPNWAAKTCANRMLGSADPEHIDSSDRSAGYKDWWRLWMQKLGNCLCRISSKLNVCVNDCWYFTVCWMKINLKSCVTANLAWF